MKNIKQNLNYLKILASPGRIAKALIKSGDKKLIAAICECVQNVMNGNVKINDIAKKKLAGHKRALRTLQAKSSLANKKKLLVQKGGSFLPIIIPTVLSLLTDIFENETR